MAAKRSLVQRCCGLQDDHEFLFNVMWIHPKSKLRELAVESELGRMGDVAEDLEKLLYVKARAKLMICDPWPEDGLEDLSREMLGEYADCRPGEHYLAFQLGCCFSTADRPSTCSPVPYEARVKTNNDGCDFGVSEDFLFTDHIEVIAIGRGTRYFAA
jgi:hypothetical protein